jgi:hypothetical protein
MFSSIREFDIKHIEFELACSEKMNIRSGLSLNALRNSGRHKFSLIMVVAIDCMA